MAQARNMECLDGDRQAAEPDQRMLRLNFDLATDADGFRMPEESPDKGTICIPCKGSPPDIMSDDRIFLAWQRTHMANERTFLSWCRTSVSLLAFGFVIERFDIFLKHLVELSGGNTVLTTSGHVIYLSLFAFFLAGLAALVSGLRFLKVRRHINTGEAAFSVVPDILVTAAVVVIVVMAIMLALPRLFEVVPQHYDFHEAATPQHYSRIYDRVHHFRPENARSGVSSDLHEVAASSGTSL